MSNYKKPVPEYLNLYNEIRQKIVSHVYKYGDKLPSKRILAADKSVSVITVEHAYGLLYDEGYIDSAERRGYFVSYSEKDCFSPEPEKIQSFTDVKKADSKDSEYIISADLYKKTARAVFSSYGERLLTPLENSGCPELKDAIVRYLAKRFGIYAKPEQIVVGSGSEYLYGIIAQIFGRHTLFAIESPSYHKIEEIYKAHDIKCDPLKMGKGGILSTELARTKAAVLHVSPFRSYPTGITASAGKKAEYLKWLEGENRFLIEDDFESEFSIGTKSVDTLFCADKSKKTFYMNSFSKTVSPAIRTAYMIIPESLVELYNEKAGIYTCPVPKFEQYLVTELLNSGNFEKHINRVRTKIRRAEK